ncbi:MAG: hypothetical protein AB7E12_11425 [Burkholderiaceae bacterium]|jgi:hypothetical protein
MGKRLMNGCAIVVAGDAGGVGKNMVELVPMYAATQFFFFYFFTFPMPLVEEGKRSTR